MTANEIHENVVRIRRVAPKLSLVKAARILVVVGSPTQEYAFGSSSGAFVRGLWFEPLFLGMFPGSQDEMNG